MGKPTIRVFTRSDTNQPVQSQSPARSLKFRLLEEEESCCVAKIRMLIRCAVTAQLICTFVFAYSCFYFSNAAAHMI